MKPVGGFFELELRKGKAFHSSLVALNTGRNALEYILVANKYKKVFIPYFTCDVVLEPFKKLGVEYAFYRINAQLEIADEIVLKENEAIFYTNYFGVKDAYVQTLAGKFGELIIDNSQAFYALPLEHVSTFYSCRKFFGVPDGAYVKLKIGIADREIAAQGHSGERFAHLLKRIDEGAEKAYDDFKANDRALANQPVLWMSELTQALMSSIDYSAIQQQRNANFSFLHAALQSTNELKTISVANSAPMIYPFLIQQDGLKEKLISNKIFVATYWPNVGEWCKDDSVEKTLYNYLIALPVDQRYEQEDMERIIKVIQS